jgi:hypothetical protein
VASQFDILSHQARVVRLGYIKLISKVVLLDFVYRLKYKIIEIQRFGSRILFPSSGKKGEKDKFYLLILLVKLASDLD